MMTKEQEREVLRQIFALIDSTEDGSYIKTAFYGCVRDAERNIDEDAAYSWYDRAQSAQRREQEAAAAKKAAEEATQNAQRKAEAAEADATGYKACAEKWKTEFQIKAQEAAAAKNEAEAARQQIIELKARLYDYMIKG